MSKTVLFPVDFSDVSFKVLDAFQDLKAMGVDKVVLLHVVDERSYQYMEAYSSLKEIQEQNLEHAHAELDKMAQQLREFGVNVASRVAVGMPVREILAAEKEDEVSMIVMGSHGRSNLSEMFLGSVAEKVIRKCTKPVFVVKR